MTLDILSRIEMENKFCYIRAWHHNIPSIVCYLLMHNEGHRALKTLEKQQECSVLLSCMTLYYNTLDTYPWLSYKWKGLTFLKALSVYVKITCG